MNKYEDSGSPYLGPLLGFDWLDLPPLTETSKETEDIKA